ncbi:iron-sulfur cluster-binding protein [candidate division KSB1 bacterium]|nr:iron-sulfur cluster-binding protein [candidate division KSB1 bacterium]
MKELKGFLQRSEVKAKDDVHRETIMKAVVSLDTAAAQTKSMQFDDWQQARQEAAKIKDYALANLPDLLEQFEQKISARGTKVLWAENVEQARTYFMDIVRERNAKKVVKSKSMITEEIELNEFLEHAGIEVLESDLGELIVQVANEKPYHIITPAIHKTKEDIAKIFHERLGAPLTDSPQELTMFARAHLRKAYLSADIGITGANFLIADRGAIVMTENEGNGRLTMACPPVHVVFCGIEKVLPRMADLSLFLPLLATSATGQQISCYNSITAGPRQSGEPDGPEQMYVILVDNGRSDLYAKATFRHSLRCIRCGACLNACPVYRTVGGHTYNTAYQGPIGSVITPHLRGLAKWGHLSSASSLCGSCTDVCPVNIDLHHLLLKNRAEANKADKGNKTWAAGMKSWAYIMSDRKKLQRFRRLGRLGEPLLPILLSGDKRQRVPAMAKKSFAELWEENEQSR